MVQHEKGSDPYRFVTSPVGETDRFYRDLLGRVAGMVPCVGSPGGPIALVLSGSLALGEGSAVRLADGSLRPGRDIDLYLVMDEDGGEIAGAKIADLHARILNALSVPGLVVDLGHISPERLRALQPSVAGTLLSRFGKVLCGDPDVLREANRPRFEDIPPWDGFLLLLNRVVEELMEIRISPSGEREEWDYWYRFGKTVRSLGISSLVVAEAFVPGLGERHEAAAALFKREGFARQTPELVSEYAFWCDQKAKPDLEAVLRRHGPPKKSGRKIGLLKREMIRTVWNWEMKRVFGAREGEKSLLFLRDAERFRRRVRAWIQHVRRDGVRGIGSVLRHAAMGLPVSPLLANYTAAVHLLLSWGPLFGEAPTVRDAELLDEAYRIVPVRPVRPETFVDSWLLLRKNVCEEWNREVMRTTRPVPEVKIT